MISLKIIIAFLLIMIVIMGITIAALCCVIFSKSKTKSDYDKHIEDDEQMDYLKKQ